MKDRDDWRGIGGQNLFFKRVKVSAPVLSPVIPVCDLLRM